MRGQTAHNRPSSSNPLGEKGDMLYLKTSILGVCSNSHFKCQASHDPFAALWSLSVLFYPDRATSITCSLNRIVWVCICVLCLPRKGDCMIRNQKSGWTFHWMLHPRANLFSDQSLMVHGSYIYRFALALYPGSLNTRLCSHIWESPRLHNVKPSPTISLRVSPLLSLYSVEK